MAMEFRPLIPVHLKAWDGRQEDAMAKESCRRSYSIAEREEAVRLTTEVGPRAAARELGLPPGTLSRWLRRPSG